LAVNINISNYEEFLLSAIDGELNGEETAALEIFMQEHPEVRKELALLESTKLSPDAGMTFDAKETLYKNTSVLSATNYERFLLDYIDNELSVSEKRELEALISQHPHIQKDLLLLQASRLTPDLSVTFGNKATLYRKERTRVRPLWWWSAAAAVVVGLTVWLLPGQRPGNDEGTQVVVNQPGTNGNSSAVQQQGNQPANTPSLADANKPATSAAEASKATAEENREGASIARTTNNAGNNTLQGNAIAQSSIDNRANKRPVPDATTTSEPKAETGIDRMPDNRLTALAKIPQPASTSGEVVQQLQEKTAQQEKILAENVAVIPEKTAVMANAEKISDAMPAAAATPANVKGELVVAVTMNGDSKLLNGVANVARFLSRKKK
jgi:anti-sigma factor RsiW